MAAVGSPRLRLQNQYSLLSFEQTKPEVPLLEKKQLLFYFEIKFCFYIFELRRKALALIYCYSLFLLLLFT
jgi:hypothetical protein